MRLCQLSLLVGLSLVVLSGWPADATADVNAFKRAWLEAGEDPVSQKAALKLLTRDVSPKGLDLLLNVAKSTAVHHTVADEAEKLLALTPEATDWLARKLGSSSDVRERTVMARALGSHTGPKARDALLEVLDDRHWQVVVRALQSLTAWQEKEVVDAIVKLAQDHERDGGRVYSDAMLALEVLTGHKLRDGSAWASWWEAHRGGFEFGEVKAGAGGAGGTVLREGQLYEDITSKHVIFIVDVSGSMQVVAGGGDFARRSRLQHMQRELKRVIDSELKSDASFNLIAFADDVQVLFKKMVKRTSSNASRADSFIDRLDAEGGTNSYGALIRAFREKDVDTIYFLSDGTPTSGEKIDHDAILGEIKSLNRVRSIQINTIAFLAGDGEAIGVIEDKDSSKRFMEQLADIGGGRYRLVE